MRNRGRLFVNNCIPKKTNIIKEKKGGWNAYSTCVATRELVGSIRKVWPGRNFMRRSARFKSVGSMQLE